MSRLRRADVCWCTHPESEHNPDGCTRCHYGMVEARLFVWRHRFRPIIRLRAQRLTLNGH